MKFPIKKKILTLSNKFYLMLLSLLGFSVACEMSREPDEYGTPCADFIIHGSVKSVQNNAPLQNIRISMNYDTTFSDSKGNFTLQSRSFPTQQIFTVKIRDTNPETSGAFIDKDTVIEFPVDNFTGGDGHWYKGKEDMNLDIYLKPKS